MDPYASVRQLSEEMKNPHLIETVLRIPPMTGKVLELADFTTLEQVYNRKMSGDIPTIDVAFDVSGIPLLLTRQSYVELRLKPKFRQQVIFNTMFFSIPTEFEINRYLWPKLNISCVESVSASFSNFGMENPTPTILPYIQSFRFNEVMKVNTMRSWNPAYLSSITDSDGNTKVIYANRFLNIPINGNFTQTKHRSPYSASLSHAANRTYSWVASDLLIHIPMQDLLPVFQIPVMPLRQTNSSSFQLRLVMRSPRHMFYSARCLNLPTAGSVMTNAAIAGDNPGATSGLDTYRAGIVSLLNAQGERVSHDVANLVMGGGTVKWLLALTNYPFCVVDDIHAFDVDFDVECELVLRALTTPLLNPLIPRFLEPFINEANEFIAQYNDIYTFSTIVNWERGPFARFNFIIHQMFYNTTHLALLFVQGPVYTDTRDRAKSLSGEQEICSVSSLFKHGHFYLQKELRVDDFNILLGSGQTALFDRPLSFEEMFAATEAALTKYDNNTMYGDLVSVSSRFHEGDAMFLFDLTHARDSGYFIDTDNRIYIEGQVSIAKYASQNVVVPPAQPPPQGGGGQPPERGNPVRTGAVFSMRDIQEEQIRNNRALVREEEPAAGKFSKARVGPARKPQDDGIVDNPTNYREFPVDVDLFIAKAMSKITFIPTFTEPFSLNTEDDVIGQQTQIVVEIGAADESFMCPVKVTTVFDGSVYNTGRTTDLLLGLVPDKLKLGTMRGPTAYFSSLADPLPTTTSQLPNATNISSGVVQSSEITLPSRGGRETIAPGPSFAPMIRSMVRAGHGTNGQRQARAQPQAQMNVPIQTSTINVEPLPVNVILGVIYRNTFSVLLDLDGTVIIQQS